MVKTGSHIRKILAAGFWVLLACGVTVVLLAAIRRSNAALCEDVNIRIKGNTAPFLAKSDIWSMMGSTGPKQFRGRAVASLDLKSLESKLQANTWVQAAELYVDKEGILQVSVTERKPVARIFTSLGSSFYLDSSGKYLPLGVGKPAMRLPVFTGLPEKIKSSGSVDSALLAGLKEISKVLAEDSLWMAQISQVDLGVDGNFDMVPMLGKHLIHFGTGEDVEDKFKRLKLFYRKVLRKTGLDYYRSISVQYKGQIIGEKDESISTSVDK